MIRRVSRKSLLILVTLLSSMAYAAGQSNTGEIRLQVIDPSGAGMQTSGKLQGSAPAAERLFQTDIQGTVTLSNLPYGTYRLELSKEAFASQSIRIEVNSATAVSRTITMALGTATAAVEVVATTPLAG